jgi:hypothetical protein
LIGEHVMIKTMRKKKEFAVISFSTTRDALAFEAYCTGSGVPGRMIPVPGEITAGCGLAWRMEPEEYRSYQADLERSGLAMEGCTAVSLLVIG